MLRVFVRTEGKVTVFLCQGRIATGGTAMRLQDAVLSSIEAGTSVLDLAEVESTDAGALRFAMTSPRQVVKRTFHPLAVERARTPKKARQK